MAVLGTQLDGMFDAGRGEAVAVSSLPVGHPWRFGGLREDRIIELAASLATLAPILVRRADLLVVDGAHRVAAARRLGLRSVPVEWFDGNALDVVSAFIERNRDDERSVTSRDREALVRWVLASEAMWSDRRIAWSCGVSPKTVARHRGSLAPPGPGSVTERRIGRDGRARPVRARAVRERVADALAEDPGASLRTIASRLAVSPETVRSVRRNLAAAVGAKDDCVANDCEAEGGAPGDGEGYAGMAPRSAESLSRAAGSDRRGSGMTARLPAPSWQSDDAFLSTDTGLSFVEWFEATAVSSSGLRRVEEVPLSRVYEIADEALRRASWWRSFAAELEARTKPYRPGAVGR